MIIGRTSFTVWAVITEGMNYVIAVLGDRIAAESAYSALEAEQFAMDEVAILGKGYKSVDEYGLVDPAGKVWKQIKLMMIWLVPFGFIAGFGFNQVTGLDTFAWAGTLGNQILGGILGAGSGAMGAFFVSNGVGVVLGSGDALSYRNCLSNGKYVVVVKGSLTNIRAATPVLRRFRPENLQGYDLPEAA